MQHLIVSLLRYREYSFHFLYFSVMNRGVRQLSHLFVSYAPGGSSSRVVEEFVASPLLNAFRKAHPDVVVETVRTKRNKPFLQAAYRNKNGHTLSLADCQSPDSVLSLCRRLADQIGRAPGQQSALKHKPFAITKTPSLQGKWDPLFNLKSQTEQLKPLKQTQTHVVGLAPPIEGAASK